MLVLPFLENIKNPILCSESGVLPGILTIFQPAQDIHGAKS